MTFDQFCTKHRLTLVATRDSGTWQCWLRDPFNRLVHHIRWSGQRGNRNPLFGFGETIPEALADIVNKMRGIELSADPSTPRGFCIAPADLLIA